METREVDEEGFDPGISDGRPTLTPRCWWGPCGTFEERIRIFEMSRTARDLTKPEAKLSKKNA